MRHEETLQRRALVLTITNLLTRFSAIPALIITMHLRSETTVETPGLAKRLQDFPRGTANRDRHVSFFFYRLQQETGEKPGMINVFREQIGLPLHDDEAAKVAEYRTRPKPDKPDKRRK